MSIRNWIAGAGLLLLSACSSGEQGFEEEALRYCDNQVRRTLAELKEVGGGSIDYTMMPRNIADSLTVWHCRKAVKEEWCSGFWPGILWYDYEVTGDEAIRQEAETIGISLGVRTAQDETRGVYLDSLDMSDYVKVKSVDFGTTGARSVLMAVRKVHASGFIQVCIDTQSNIVGTVNVPESGEWTEVRADLDQPVTGIHDVYFRFRATDTSNRKNLMQFDYWQFFTNTATGVADALSDAPSQEDGATYDLSGRKVEQPGKGIYIRDGKKFLNRP